MLRATRKPAGQQNTWYSGAASLLLEPANQLLWGAESVGIGNRRAHAREGCPRLQRPGGFFLSSPKTAAVCVICCDLRSDASSQLHAAR